ncbi:MAG: Mu-like prophage major head subunit gpT family protein, partial [Victivallales bacterium]|nr:Mu-like prophage major head subunit gpT family protein [Victivallales bacterium]
LSVDGLKAAVKKFRDLKDEAGRLLNATPAILLVSSTNEVTAGQLYNDQYLIATGVGSSAATATNGNPFQHKYKPVATAYLEDSSYTGHSATAYYLLCNPALRAAIQVCFLDGVQTPTIQSSAMEFNTLGIQFRAFFDFGAAKMDPRAGVKVTGA